jgi:hypothetical protein
MSKGGSSTVTQTLDPQSQQYVDAMRRLALGYTGAAGPGAGASPMGLGGRSLKDVFGRVNGNASGSPMAPPLPPGIQQAIDQYGQYAKGGNLGFSALTGDAGAQQQFLNPYLSQMNPFFQQQRQQAVNAANEQATLAGAFGGDRSQIGAAQAGNLADQTQAGFNYQAFNDAMQRALQASNLGYGAIGAGAFLPQAYQSGQLGLLQQGLGPTGSTQTQSTSSDLFSQLLGLGTTLGGLFLGGPAGAKAGSAGMSLGQLGAGGYLGL